MINTLLNCRGRILDTSKPVIMGILNVTPDSFFDGGKFSDENNIRTHVAKMVGEGAAIIDVGGVSSKPGSTMVTEKEEWSRLLPALKLLTKEFPDILVSVDTCRSGIALKSIESGAVMINDISGGVFDKKMFNALGGRDVPYIMMHMQGTPETMQKNPVYENVTNNVISFFVQQLKEARNAGIKDIIIDPGFGFGKTVEHNFQLLDDLSAFKILHCPIMAGLSRKSMINKTLSIKPEEALNGTTILNTIALLKGASILRVHDVKEAAQAATLTCRLKLNDVI